MSELIGPAPTSLPASLTQRISLRVTQFKELSKSGIVALVLISVTGGYLIGHPFELKFDWLQFFCTFLGILFLASSSSAFNQWQERAIDGQMPRTARRPLPSGNISGLAVLTFVGTTLVAGLGLLACVSMSLLALGGLAVFSYNGLYTLWWKKHWAYAAVPGAIPGALPILMGHVAANGHIGAPAGIYLFSLLFFWQMPHFWVLALRFREDYRKGGFPTLPVSRGEGVTLLQIGVWGLAYVGLSLMAPLFLQVGLIYFAITLPISAMTLRELRGFIRAPEAKNWLRFFLWVNFSLIGYVGAAAADLWSVYLLRWWTG